MTKEAASTTVRRHTCHACGVKVQAPEREALPRGWVFELVPAPVAAEPPKLRPTCPLCQRSRFPEWVGDHS